MLSEAGTVPRTVPRSRSIPIPTFVLSSQKGISTAARWRSSQRSRLPIHYAQDGLRSGL